jgi:transcriptional regulator superfamily
MAKSLSPSDICPMDLGINILSGKWKLRILWNIYNKKIIRFNELQKVLGNITTKTLTEQLRELEDKKIIKRTVYPEIPPKVEYSLTETGKTIEPVLKSLCEWGEEYMKSSK